VNRFAYPNVESGSRLPIVIDHDALIAVTTTSEAGASAGELQLQSARPPLEEYLFALAYLWRLGPALQVKRRIFTRLIMNTWLGFVEC
jgi:hypothetical protein